MPKTHTHLWGQIITPENIRAAWEEVMRGRRFAPVIVHYWASLEENLYALRLALASHTWKPRPLRRFIVQRPKFRAIQAPACGDRVVHHALMRVCMPLFERRFSSCSYACRKNKGTHAASLATTRALRSATAAWKHPYVLKGDVSSFFASIDHTLLLERLRRVIADVDVLRLFETLICTPDYDGVGLPLGSLTSQWLANLYLDGLDHLVKDELGVRHYMRYMDDWVLIGPSKAWCHSMLDTITRYLAVNKLRVNPKTAIFPSSHGIDFVGYRHWADHTLPRKSTVKRARRLFAHLRRAYAIGKVDMDYVRPRVASFFGYIKHADSYTTVEHICENMVLCRKSPGKDPRA